MSLLLLFKDHHVVIGGHYFPILTESEFRKRFGRKKAEVPEKIEETREELLSERKELKKKLKKKAKKATEPYFQA